MPFRFDKFTIKAQEAIQSAVELAGSRGNPQATPVHLLQALVAEREGIVRPLLEKIGVDRGQLERVVEAELSSLPKVSGGAQPQPDQDLIKVFEAATAESHAMKDEFVSTDHLLLALAKAPSKAKNVLGLAAVSEQDLLAGLQAVHRPKSRTEVSGAGKVRHRPRPASQPRQARSGDRPRLRDSPRNPGALAAHKKQPRADW